MQRKRCKACGRSYYGHGNSFYCKDCRGEMERSLRRKRTGYDPMGWYKKIVADQKAGKYSGVKGAKINSDFSKIDRKHARRNER